MWLACESWGGLLKEFEEVLSSPRDFPGHLFVGVFPTGYGKSSLIVRSEAIRDGIRNGNRIVHVLPMRAIVADLYEKARGVLGDLAGYQAGINMPGLKTPYLASRYVITTVDSFLMSFYGIPVYEFMRSMWHSDMVYASARSFDAIVLDEFHLMASGEGEGVASGLQPVDVLAKQLAAMSYPVASHLRRGPVVLFTATLSPSILAYYIAKVTSVSATHYKNKDLILKIIVYDRLIDEKAFKSRLEEALESLNISLDIIGNSIDFVSDIDPCFENARVAPMTVRVERVPYNNHKGPDVSRLVDLIVEENYMDGASRIFVAFNSWKRATRIYREARPRLKSAGFTTVILTGKMVAEDVKRALEIIKKSSQHGDRIVLFATQAVEAGVDFDFDALITEVAPAPQLIQRAGRIARSRRPSTDNIVMVMVPSIGNKDDVGAAVMGVYDIEATRKTLERLVEGLKKTNLVDIRVRLAGTLVAASDSAIEEKVRSALFVSRPIEEYLEFMIARANTSQNIIRIIDSYMDGSIIRNSALIPGIPYEKLDSICEGLAGETVTCAVGRNDIEDLVDRYTLSLDKTTLLSLSVKDKTDYMCRAKFAVSICSKVNGECHIVVSEKAFVSESMLSSIRRIVASLRRYLQDREGVEKNATTTFLGAVIEKGRYQDGVGLIPLEQVSQCIKTGQGLRQAQHQAKKRGAKTKRK